MSAMRRTVAHRGAGRALPGLPAGAGGHGGNGPAAGPFSHRPWRKWPGCFRSSKSSRSSARAAWERSTRPASRRWIGFVALKILPPQTASGPGFAERFNREARALARLSHPNIVAVHEFGQVNGLPFFIMEFVDGLNLRQLERSRKTLAARGAADRAADLRGAAVRPRRRHRPSRHQTGEHPARQEGPREDRRFRHRQDSWAGKRRRI